MRLARKSGAFSRVFDRHYKYTYLNYLIQLFLRRGLRLKYVKIISEFLILLKNRFKYRYKGILERVFNRYVPVISFVARKVAANVYFLPWFIGRMRAQSVILRWFYKSVKERLEINFAERIFNEFCEMSRGYGKTVRKVEEYYQLAVKSRPFMRFLRKRRKVFRSRIKKFGVK